jgi:hypothetical protein
MQLCRVGDTSDRISGAVRKDTERRPVRANCRVMGEDSQHFRTRARKCRSVAAQAEGAWATMLLDLARELDSEAERMERQQRALQCSVPPRQDPGRIG